MNEKQCRKAKICNYFKEDWERATLIFLVKKLANYISSFCKDDYTKYLVELDACVDAILAMDQN